MPFYTVRSHKRQDSQPDLPWTNTWELESASAIDAGAAQGGMAACRNFERKLTFGYIEFHDATLSSWVAEDDEDNPPDELFQWLGGIETGLRAMPAAPAPLDDTMFIRRLPQRGQKGKLFLRGALEDTELQITPRRRVLKPAARANYVTMVQNFWIDLVDDLSNYGLTVAMVSYPRIGWEEVPTAPGAKPKFKPVYGDELYARTVVEMTLGGTTPLQLKQH